MTSLRKQKSLLQRARRAAFVLGKLKKGPSITLEAMISRAVDDLEGGLSFADTTKSIEALTGSAKRTLENHFERLISLGFVERQTGQQGRRGVVRCPDGNVVAVMGLCLAPLLEQAESLIEQERAHAKMAAKALALPVKISKLRAQIKAAAHDAPMSEDELKEWSTFCKRPSSLKPEICEALLAQVIDFHRRFFDLRSSTDEARVAQKLRNGCAENGVPYNIPYKPFCKSNAAPQPEPAASPRASENDDSTAFLASVGIDMSKMRFKKGGRPAEEPARRPQKPVQRRQGKKPSPPPCDSSAVPVALALRAGGDDWRRRAKLHSNPQEGLISAAKARAASLGLTEEALQTWRQAEGPYGAALAVMRTDVGAERGEIKNPPAWFAATARRAAEGRFNMVRAINGLAARASP